MRGGTTRARAMTPECEHPARYPDEPPGMTGWWEWASEKAETHEQKLCSHCKRWAIWEPRADGVSTFDQARSVSPLRVVKKEED